ncbi:MAG TPA: hypothetical protein VLG50_00645 [Candidatus Saccharimonadales bacterium]|nr:hypothetical protein [Candidatus Saccharimonadales bacterium]
MNFKNLVILSLLSLSGFVFARHKGTMVTHFMIDPSVLSGQVKTFINNTGYMLSVRYTIQDRDFGLFYTQEPTLKEGQSLQIDFSNAAQYSQDWKTPSKNYEFSLEILRVLRYPTRLTEDVTKGLKKGNVKHGKYAHMMDKSEFLRSNTIEFFEGINRGIKNKLSCRSVC